MTDDHAELMRRRALTEDAARPDAVERRYAGNGRTARENIADLVDAGSFVEYGRFAIAAQRFRRDVNELIERTPADGLVAGTARINGDLFGYERSACAVLSYDYTVLAGTQGALGHRKKDRLFELIERMRLPTVFFAEGGGGRPRDTEAVRDRRRHRPGRNTRPDRRDADGGHGARTSPTAPAVRGYLVGGKQAWDGAAMAPLGEWSLEATVFVGARGMPGTVG
jgi:acetyl-CoA carboxylase carboxyltransferase component